MHGGVRLFYALAVENFKAGVITRGGLYVNSINLRADGAAVLNDALGVRLTIGELPRRLFDADLEINHRRFEIENRLMIMIATQQPMAHDLRVLASILEINSELERMGDYAKGISNINLRMGDMPLLKPLIDIPRMAQKGADMLHRALTAFINEDMATARQIPAEDDEVDELYKQVYRELMTFVIADPTSIERANWLLWAAHNLERFADRVTNICERTVFIVTGELHEFTDADKEFWSKK